MNERFLNASTGACGLALCFFLIWTLADSMLLSIVAGIATGIFLTLMGYYFLRALTN